ncbi:MAG: hypothetical protein GY820_19735, partial [Gammaproteobacteria bacterium]|nr:hypothetical protein [Gammaproteobacteria bacterium]
TGTVQKDDEKIVPEVIVSPKGEAASDPNVGEGESKTSSHHPLEGDGEDSVSERQRGHSQSSGGKKADSTMEDLRKLSLSQDEGDSKGADAQKGESTNADGISEVVVVDQEPPLPNIRPVGAKGKRAKQAEKKRRKRAQRLVASIDQQQGEAGASGGVDPGVMIMEDDLSNSTEQLTTSGTGSEGEQEDQEEEQAEEATEGQEPPKEENMEE